MQGELCFGVLNKTDPKIEDWILSEFLFGGVGKTRGNCQLT